jgi:hypothetical protein
MADGWTLCHSRSQNRPYWFQTSTGKSVWEDPNAAPRAPAPPFDPLHPRSFAASNADAAAAGTHNGRYREAVLALCITIAEGGSTHPSAPGWHRFPPCPAEDTAGMCDYAVAEVADELGLQCLACGGEEPVPRHMAVWRAGFEPTEVRAAAAAEARLEAEAAARKVAEEAEAAASSAAARKAATGAAGVGARSSRPAATASAVAGLELVDIKASGSGAAVALAQERAAAKRDKRSMTEMAEDIRRKKARREEGCGEGAL